AGLSASPLCPGPLPELRVRLCRQFQMNLPPPAMFAAKKSMRHARYLHKKEVARSGSWDLHSESEGLAQVHDFLALMPVSPIRRLRQRRPSALYLSLPNLLHTTPACR